MTIFLVLILLIIYILISEFYLKIDLEIKSRRRGIIFKGRKKVYIAIEILFIVLFVLSTIKLNGSFIGKFYPVLPMFTFFVFIHFFRGLEEWVERKDEKSYYHEWLASITFFLMMLIFFIGEYF